MADSVERSPQHREGPSALETLVLAEKTIGLSDLEVAAKLMLSECTVRSIVRKHCRDAGVLNGFSFSLRVADPELCRRRAAGLERGGPLARHPFSPMLH